MRKELTGLKEATGIQPLVSIIIPTYNRQEMVIKCVKSILNGNYGNVEIIVVDNASTDNTVNELKRHYGSNKRVILTILDKNMMAAGGRNAGIALAKGDYILFLDSDNEVYPDTVKLLVKAFSDRPDVDYIGLTSINAQRDDTIWLLSADYNWCTSMMKNKGENIPADEKGLERFYDTYYVPNAFAVTRKAVEAIGGFDEEYYIMFEEADYGYRLAKAGMKAVVCTDVRTHHLGYLAANEDEQVRKLGIGDPRRAYHFARNRFIFMKKFAPWYGKIVFMLFTCHLFTVYYCYTALKCKRKDIAVAYLRGASEGFFGITGRIRG